MDDNRAIFMFRDGGQAWDAKDYLIEQERCLSVTIENKVYPGLHHSEVNPILLTSFYISSEIVMLSALLCTLQEKKDTPKKKKEKKAKKPKQEL